MIRPETIAMLLLRGCPEHALTVAYEVLSHRIPADTIEAMLAQVDEAIIVAASMTMPAAIKET